ncbi:MAG TPA: histidine phosphatase family protein [Allosphingosinicella sp.]|uniref:histidine phosphatase family protein n=1 Tax=Allosphingosinicella sp. TaxID=2823234 RepID=UPI002F27C625
MSRRFFIARHGETVFNAAARIQGETTHTPLTRAGFAQAEAIGEVLFAELGHRPVLELWASDSGRALQTLAIIGERLGLDWRDVRADPRLREIDMGSWGGRYYADVRAEAGRISDAATALFTRRAPGGEWFDEIAARLNMWIDEHGRSSGDKLIITHGVTSRVLRGLLGGAPPRPECGAPVADRLPQGSIVRIEGSCETVLFRGRGAAPG